MTQAPTSTPQTLWLISQLLLVARLVSLIDRRLPVCVKVRDGEETKMRRREMERLKVALGKLTAKQRAELSAELAAMESRPAATTVVENRFDGRPTCPH